VVRKEVDSKGAREQQHELRTVHSIHFLFIFDPMRPKNGIPTNPTVAINRYNIPPLVNRAKKRTTWRICTTQTTFIVMYATSRRASRIDSENVIWGRVVVVVLGNKMKWRRGKRRRRLGRRRLERGKTRQRGAMALYICSN
jgi:hypothetical protein